MVSERNELVKFKKDDYLKVDPEYIENLYVQGLSTGLKKFKIAPVATSGPIDNVHHFPLKSIDHEKVEERIAGRSGNSELPEGCYILPRNCPIEL